MCETTEDKVEFDAQIDEREQQPDIIYPAKIAYALDIEQDLVIEIPVPDGYVRATLHPNDAAVLLRQICAVMQVTPPALPWFPFGGEKRNPVIVDTDSDIPW
jgi:hypothetical protein